MNEKYYKTLIEDNKLHDAEIIGLKLIDNCFYIKVSCKNMNISNCFDKIDNIIVTIKIDNINKLNFDYFDGPIFINTFKLIKDNDISIIINNDIEIVGSTFNITFDEIKKYNEANRKLDNFLKNN